MKHWQTVQGRASLELILVDGQLANIRIWKSCLKTEQPLKFSKLWYSQGTKSAEKNLFWLQTSGNELKWRQHQHCQISFQGLIYFFCWPLHCLLTHQFWVEFFFFLLKHIQYFRIIDYICHGRLITVSSQSVEKVSFAPLTLLRYFLVEAIRKTSQKLSPGKYIHIWNAFLPSSILQSFLSS